MYVRCAQLNMNVFSFMLANQNFYLISLHLYCYNFICANISNIIQQIFRVNVQNIQFFKFFAFSVIIPININVLLCLIHISYLDFILNSQYTTPINNKIFTTQHGIVNERCKFITPIILIMPLCIGESFQRGTLGDNNN